MVALDQPELAESGGKPQPVLRVVGTTLMFVGLGLWGQDRALLLPDKSTQKGLSALLLPVLAPLLNAYGSSSIDDDHIVLGWPVSHVARWLAPGVGRDRTNGFPRSVWLEPAMRDAITARLARRLQQKSRGARPAVRVVDDTATALHAALPALTRAGAISSPRHPGSEVYELRRLLVDLAA